MLQISKILYALDLSNISPVVAPWAELMAQQFRAELHVLHVVPGLEFAGVAFASDALIARDYPLMIAKTRPWVDDFCLKNFKSVKPAVIEVLGGSPAREIVKYAKEKGMDLIVMGTHSQVGLERQLFGSVADKVTRTSSVPVVTIPPHLQ